MTISLVTSASYVDDELSAEFGRLPAAFLPVGHQRLYQVQIDLLGPGTYLTLPESYVVPLADEQQLAAATVVVIRVPDGLKLAQSILYALEMIGETPGAVRILHGDTVIYDLPAGTDIFAVGDAPDAYEWGIATTPSEGPADPGDDAAPRDEVLAGYFAFSDGTALRRSLARSQGDFVGAVRQYHRTVGVTERHVDRWLDFGHLQTYYRSRCSIRTQRAFNDLDISFQVVEKRSTNGGKLAAEAAWYRHLPAPLRLYTPAFLGEETASDGSGCYRIEYLPIPSLHELFVFGDLGPATWGGIVGSCFDFMRAAIGPGSDAAPKPVIRELTIDKTAGRLQTFLSASGIDVAREWRYRGRALPSLGRIAEIASRAIDVDATDWLGIMHGDLCFTNIFYDFRTQRVRLIDPRGTIDGVTPSVRGDARYDMAKLNHSIAGAYDFILAGRYTCTGFAERDLGIAFPADSAFDRLQQSSADFALAGLRLGDPQITAITIHLFLSMLPLHADNPHRQQAFVANALRLFAEVLEPR